MMRKPDTIVYGTDEVPPAPMLALLSVQHALVVSIFLVVPLVIIRAARLPLSDAENMISLTMIALAAATVLQITRRGPLGSGLLAIPAAQSVYVPGSVIAARTGGLAAVAGLLLVASSLEMLLSRFLVRLRGALPTELSGLIVLVTGLGVAQTGMDNIVNAATAAGSAWLEVLVVAAMTLAIMVGLSVWGRGPVRTLGAIAGLVCGYLASLMLGLVDPQAMQSLAGAPVLALPAISLTVPAVSAGLLLPALVTGLAITLNSTGALTAAQRLHDADWKRQDLDGLGRGLLADGIGTVVAALIGACGVSASAASVGLTAAARATSRVIGYAVAVIFLGLAFVPKWALLVLGIPAPVLGAALVFLSCSLLIGGVTMMTSRLLDARKTFTLGIAFAFAVATPALARAQGSLPEWMAPVIVSPLLASALVALVLNPLLRLGIRQQVQLAVAMDPVDHAAIQAFVSRAGATWGARREVIEQAQGSIAECIEAVADAELARGESLLTLGFNELQLEAQIIWHGSPLVLSDARPTKAEMLTDESAAARMAGYLVSRLASRVTSRADGGDAEIHLVFFH